MKVLILIALSLTACFAFPMLGGYQPVGDFEISYDPDIQNCVEYGKEQLVSEAVSKGESSSSSSDYQLSKINSVYRQITDEENNYKIDCEYENSNKEVMKAQYQVSYNKYTSYKKISSSSYSFKKQSTVTETVESFYTEMDSNEIKYSSEIQGALDYGLGQVCDSALSENKISTSGCTISKVNSVKRQVKDSNFLYKCDVDINNEDGSVLTSDFTISYQPVMSKYKIASYSYKVKSSSSSSSSLSSSSSRSSSSSSSSSQSSSLSSSLSSSSSSSGSTSSSVYVEQQFNSEQTRDECLQWGLEKVIHKATVAGEIPDTSYDLINIVSSSQEESGQSIKYKFECQLQNKEGWDVTASFTVKYNSVTYKKTLSSYKYSASTTITTAHDFAAPAEVERETETIIEVPEVESETELFIGTQEVEKDTEAFIETNLYSLDTLYTQLNQEEINTDAVVQDCLDYGTERVYTQGVFESKLPVSSFEISNIISVSKQSMTEGDYYKCDVELANEEGTKVQSTFTVFYQVSTGEKSLSEYTYNVNVKDEAEIEVETDINISTSTTTEYVDIDVSEATSNYEIQNVMTYGIEEVIQIGKDKKKITSGSEFQISKILSLSANQVYNEAVYYKCSVELTNDQSSLLTMDFTVYLDYNTMEPILKAYSYKTRTVSQAVKDIDVAYVECTEDEVTYDREIQSCMEYGIQQVIEDSSNYEVSQVNSVKRQVSQSAMYYKFDVELTSKTSSSKTIQTTFTIYYKPETQEKNVKAYSYKMRSSSKSSSSHSSSSSSHSSSSSSHSSSSHSSSSSSSSSSYKTSSKYSKVSVSKAKTSSSYKSILNYGVDECLSNLVKYNVITDSNYDVQEIVNVYQQKGTSGDNYKFRVKLDNSYGIQLEVSFEVNDYYGEKSLINYAIEGYSTLDEGNALIVDCEDADNSDVMVGSYERVADFEIDTSSSIKKAIDYGVKQTVKKIVKKESYSHSDFKVKQVKRVYRESVNSSNYRVESTLQNSVGTTMDCNFLVSYDESSGTKDLISYSYFSY